MIYLLLCGLVLVAITVSVSGILWVTLWAIDRHQHKHDDQFQRYRMQLDAMERHGRDKR